MFYLDKNTPLDIKLLSKMIERFRLNVQPKLERYKNYYDGIQNILNKSYADPHKPCSRTVVNYCLNIANSYAGYLATPGYISYSGENLEEIMDILRYNDYQAEDAEFLLHALVYGTAAELMYQDEMSQTRFRLINPTTCFGVYDDSLTNDLLYFVRMYKASEWDDTDTYHVDVYSDYDVRHYTMNGQHGTPTFISEEPHYFSQCPANIFTLPDEKSIFDCVMGLQDAANELLNSEIDDFSAFCDAYLVLTGGELEEEGVAEMRQNRIIQLPEGATANWLTKNASDAQVENMLNRIHASIYRTAQCPDFSSESFVGGVSSGIAIQYRLTGMETRAGNIEALMKKALQRRVEIICGMAALKFGEEVFRDIEIKFIRNIPEDITSTINLVNSLKGTVSDATLLGQIPFVADINAELEALQAQKAQNMELYGFGLQSANENLDEEE